MKHLAFPNGVTRDDLVAWYREGRRRSEELFRIPIDEAYYDRPIALRNPIVFYDGHLPAFSVNTLIKLALQQPPLNAGYEVLFARGIDPDSEDAAKPPTDVWPSRAAIADYGRAADQLVTRVLCDGPIESDQPGPLHNGEAALTILEHEQMHHETLLYMFHNMPYDRKRRREPINAAPESEASSAVQENDLVPVPRGKVTLGADREETFGWDNEFPRTDTEVADFAIQRHNVTNGEFLEFVEAGGYRDASLWTDAGWQWIVTSAIQHPHFWTTVDGALCWRGMFRLHPLDPRSPVYVTHAEAAAYARWRGMRLPTEAEYHRAAFGTPSGEERQYPWGDEPPDASRGNFDLVHWDPVPVGSYPRGASAWGVHDLVGNGWEWTGTVFDGFTGFEPMPSYSVYSTDFFDGQHYVLKGASPATARHLVRRSFRNWFRPTYPYVYATFRCVKD